MMERRLNKVIATVIFARRADFNHGNEALSCKKFSAGGSTPQSGDSFKFVYRKNRNKSNKNLSGFDPASEIFSRAAAPRVIGSAIFPLAPKLYLGARLSAKLGFFPVPHEISFRAETLPASRRLASKVAGG
jgi:hypothetical protein